MLKSVPCAKESVHVRLGIMQHSDATVSYSLTECVWFKGISFMQTEVNKEQLWLCTRTKQPATDADDSMHSMCAFETALMPFTQINR